MSSFLRVINIHKSFSQGLRKKLHVLKGVDFNLERGEFLCIVGPSGAGKSTLLHILGGLDEPDKGNVFVDDVDIFKLNRNRRASLRLKKIGFVFQFYHLLGEFNVLENVMIPLQIARGINRKEAKTRTQTLLEEVGLEDRWRHRPGELSGGESQRAAVARALVLEPEVILCDEPTGNLDSETGSRLLELLFRLNKEKGKTFVVVSHDEAITKRASQVIHIRDGCIY